MSNMLEAALAWYDVGCNVIPAATDGTKRPAFDWKEFQTKRPHRTVLEDIWIPRYPDGIGLICGAISGNLEMLELEGRATTSDHLDAITDACRETGASGTWNDLIQRGYAEWTPSGGLHLLYRISDHEVPGNTKVARRPANAQELAIKPEEKWKVLAETRGEGGFVIVAPSGGRTHPTGDSWSVAAGEIGRIPTITWDQRENLIRAFAKALDEMPMAPVYERPTLRAVLGKADRPGDDFNARADWHDILTPHGWGIHHQTNQETYWTRPGKAKVDGWSATTGYANDQDRLFVWSSSTDFMPETPYSKFAAYALLEHGGDYRMATKTLSAKGYGSPLEQKSQPSGDRFLLDSIQASGTEVLVKQDETIPDTTPGNPSTPVDWNEEFSAPRLTPQQFLDEEFTLRGAGNLFARAFEDAFKYCYDTKAWWYWDGKVWRIDGERHEEASKVLIDIGTIAAREAEIAEEPFAKKLRNHVTKMANAGAPNASRWGRSDKRVRIKCDELDSNSHLVTVANGILDVPSQTMMPHDPKMLLTRQIPVAFDKDAQAPRWQAFLEQALPDTEIRDYLQRAIGHTLLGNAEQRALFLLHGPSGTGKSVFIRTMEQLFGDFAETATPATLNGSSKTATLTNDLNDLRGKRFVSLSELDEGEILNESLVKRLTGGDTAKSRGLWQENSKWRVEFSMWLATNNLPRLNSDDNAIWRRVKPINFAQVAMNNGGEILQLAEKIFAEEASGILNWVLDGVRMYQERGLGDLDQITQAVEAYRKDVDIVEQFLADAAENQLVTVSEGSEIPSSRLYAIFTSWCQRNGVKGVLAQRRFSPRIVRAGFVLKKTAAANIFVGIGMGSHGLLGTFP